MKLERVKLVIASEGCQVTDDANVILRAFSHPRSDQLRRPPSAAFAKNNLFDSETGKCAIVAVGYDDDQTAVSAIVGTERVHEPHDYQQAGEARYIGKPCFEMELLATDPDARRRGHARRLVEAITHVSFDAGFDSVQAIWVADGAVPFWNSCGFTALPFITFGDDRVLHNDGSNQPLPADIALDAQPAALDRLATFASAANGRNVE